MDLTEKDVRFFALIILISLLGVMIFLLIKPIILAIIGGLILAYAFFPIYRLCLKYVPNRNLSASIVCIIAILVVLVPLYFIVPLLIDQIFNLFEYSQSVDVNSIIVKIFPSASESFRVNVVNTYGTITNKGTSYVLNSLVSLLIGLPEILFNFAIVAFVFFYTIRDYDKLASFMLGISPISRHQEKKIIKSFKDITNSIVFGQIFIGLIQGLIAGAGFVIFGIPGALVLTILAIVFSIIPIVGPFFIWVPASVYLLSTESTGIAITFILYNLLLVSTVDNLLRIYLLSKNSNMPQVIVLIGMIGGILLFGVLGLILGPLLLSYFIIIIEEYRNGTFSSLFKRDE